MDVRQAQELLQKYLDGKCSDEERAVFESWYNQSIQTRPEPSGEPDYKKLHHQLAQSLPAGRPQKQKLWLRFTAAAAVIFLLGSAVYFYTNHFKSGFDNSIAYDNDVPPGKNTAVLKLADGKTISLSEAKTGVVIDAATFTYNDGTAITSAEGKAKKATDMNTISTPRGGTYQVMLPDGTKVWLNAASVLNFPSTFAGLAERKVALEGEAYFEVAKDSKHPFQVRSHGQEVEVLGTHFNINGYGGEEPVKTTLLEGSVRLATLGYVNRRENSAIYELGVTLKPGEQAISYAGKFTVVKTDAASAIDWKNGDFIFEGEKLESIMYKIARWYDVEIVYADGAPKNFMLGGFVSRSKPISAVLELMEKTKRVRFKVEGRKITVLPQ